MEVGEAPLLHDEEDFVLLLTPCGCKIVVERNCLAEGREGNVIFPSGGHLWQIAWKSIRFSYVSVCVFDGRFPEVIRVYTRFVFLFFPAWRVWMAATVVSLWFGIGRLPRHRRSSSSCMWNLMCFCCGQLNSLVVVLFQFPSVYRLQLCREAPNVLMVVVGSRWGHVTRIGVDTPKIEERWGQFHFLFPTPWDRPLRVWFLAPSVVSNTMRIMSCYSNALRGIQGLHPALCVMVWLFRL
eukprot:Gb_06643 [translate_table: standard]